MRRIGFVLDGVAVAVAIAAAAYLGFRRPVPGVYDPFPSGWAAALVYATAAVGVGLVLAGARRSVHGKRAALARALSYGLVVLGAWMSTSRIEVQRQDAKLSDHWPPRIEEIRSRPVNVLPAADRAQWALRVAAHRLASTASGSALTIPRDWEFPDDVQLAVRRAASGRLQLWSRTREGWVACVSIPSHRSRKGEGGQAIRYCGEPAVPGDLFFRSPSRNAVAAVPVRDEQPDDPWMQYRGDDARSGAADDAAAGPAAAAGWRATIDGDIRSSVSVVGDLVLAGAHGTGSLAALDIETGRHRWDAIVPNWIHQDPVSDGRIVVVGFGDNRGSFAGRAPSGVAAYELETGRHLWTEFDEGSVMTSPVIHRGVIVYGTGAGILRKRELETGRLLGERMLPGFVVMAPPAGHGDTVVFSLDHNRVCAVLVSTLASVWCRTVDGMRMMGHAAPTIAGDLVIVSGGATITRPSARELLELPLPLVRNLLLAALHPTDHENLAGQAFESLDLKTGATRWSSEVFESRRPTRGHIAGTAAVSATNGVIVLPISNVVVAFDTRTGRVNWTAESHDARGPPLILDEYVVLGGRDGVIEVRQLSDGAVVCTVKRTTGYDRAGPTLARGLVIFADLSGGIEAIPADDLLRCSVGPGPA